MTETDDVEMLRRQYPVWTGLVPRHRHSDLLQLIHDEDSDVCTVQQAVKAFLYTCFDDPSPDERTELEWQRFTVVPRGERNKIQNTVQTRFVDVSDGQPGASVAFTDLLNGKLLDSCRASVDLRDVFHLPCWESGFTLDVMETMYGDTE